MRAVILILATVVFGTNALFSAERGPSVKALVLAGFEWLGELAGAATGVVIRSRQPTPELFRRRISASLTAAVWRSLRTPVRHEMAPTPGTKTAHQLKKGNTR